MLEYVLFSKDIRQLFIVWLQENNIEFQLTDNEEEYMVLIDEDIEENIEAKIEAQYDLLLNENARVTNKEDDSPNSVHLVGIQFTNCDGEIGQVRISPKLANQIQQCLTTAELQAFVQLIADEVTAPKNRPLCQV